MKFIKWCLILMLAVVIGISLYLKVFFDPNDFKPEIVDAVKKQTGRELVIGDDLSWSFFPTIGINLGGVSFSNPEGFTPKSMIEVNKAVAEVAIMPLLRKQIEIAQLSLDGAKIYLVTRKNGSSSLDGLTGGDNSVASPDKVTPSGSSRERQLVSLNVGGVSITNSQINVIDEAQGKTQVLTLTNLALGAFSLDQFAPLAFVLTAEMPDLQVSSKGEGQIKLSQDLNQFVIEKLAIETEIRSPNIPNNQLTTSVNLSCQFALDKKQLSLDIQNVNLVPSIGGNITGSGSLQLNYGLKVPQIRADLQFGDIDLDALMSQSESTQTSTSQSTAATHTAEPDLSALKAIELSLKLAVKSIKVAHVSTQNWLLELGLKNGLLDLNQLTANLYQGTLQAKALLDVRSNVASYQFDKQVIGVQVRPLLKDAANLEILAGTADFSIKGKGSSLKPEQLKKNLLANGRFNIINGALYGVNIPHRIRSARAKLMGDFSSDTKEERKTDFSSLTGSFSLEHGVITNPDLAMASPLLRLSGKGNANLLTEALDYRLIASLVDSFKGQGGRGKEALMAFDIPLAITGTFQKPEYALDTKALLNDQFKEETQKVKEKLKDSLLKRFGSF